MMERIISPAEDTARGLKNIGRIIASNIAYYVCIFLPILLASQIWFDEKFTIGWRLLYNGLFVVTILVIGERMMIYIGSSSGKKNPECTEKNKSFEQMRDKVLSVGLLKFSDFAKEARTQELDEAIDRVCQLCRLDREQYESVYKTASFQEILFRVGIFHLATAIRIYSIRHMRPLDITKEMVLQADASRNIRQGIGETGQEYTNRKMYGAAGLAMSILTAAFAGGISFTATAASAERIIYFCTMLLLLLWRMASGYITGINAYAVVHIRSLDSKILYMHKYIEYLRTSTKNSNDKGDIYVKDQRQQQTHEVIAGGHQDQRRIDRAAVFTDKEKIPRPGQSDRHIHVP